MTTPDADLALLRRARDMIAALQWSYEYVISDWTSGNACPMCGADSSHNPDCELLALLAALNERLGDGQ